MKEAMRARLQIPQGTEAFYLDEARRHHELRRRLEQRFSLWGYLPVQTPVMDYYDVYRDLLAGEDARGAYRLVDREGDLLMLRSDVTLFLAKQMGLILRPEDLPIRVWYSDTILRHQDADDISRNEFHQSGVELIGLTGQQADLEVMTLLLELLTDVSPTRFFLHVGSRRLIHLLCPEGGSRNTVIRALALRDTPGMTMALKEAGHSSKGADRLARLLCYIGPPDGTSDLRSDLGLADPEYDDVFAEVSRVSDSVRCLDDVGFPDCGRVDLSEVASQPYYTGIVFQVYLEGLDAPLASGGRYDGLLGSFGFDAPSVGFSIMLRKLEAQIARLGGRDERPTPTVAKGSTFAERYRNATMRRQGGETVTL